MLRALPGVFCAGEMLDWDAPTGGYLLTACLATGAQAGARRAGASAARQRRQPLNYNRAFDQSDKDEKGMLVMTPRTTAFPPEGLVGRV